ncbi:non-ribosomal peptide synthetase [Streptomyces sp. V2]|uniref:non-ribosomal peptide synthetase n=1 Tax=Streptomyces sp. V2 TaxID=1424099 RepID=UPI000D66E149|nr:non-ribosomal peptide synthetase [Streptomyces sp. V2]PWG10662.1 non-ribosomal peptide synthetase [Streptomyces sp. V2]
MKAPLLLHEAFLAHAARTPEAPALHWAGSALTYAELERRSARLAHRLIAAGTGPDDLVGVSVGRGPALVVALLAVMRAGGAWVPLDPAYPRDRLEYMLRDSGAGLVIADETAARVLPDGVRLLSPDAPDGSDAPAVELPRRGARDLAYVIYTSGSTGRPKGVLVEHGSVAATVAGMRDEWGVTAADRVLQFAPSSFDASVCETGIALTAGASLVLAGPDSVVPGPGLVRLLAEGRVSVAVLPPSVAAAVPQAELPALRTVVCAGEALPAEVAARWGRGRRMINAYGPTETSICATSGDVLGSGTPDIGSPIAGVRLALLDADGLPVADGEVGELVVSGAGVTRGYHGRPALTAERFVPAEGGGRAYRTGDLARRLPDGRYAYVGRADHQVKIRGFRVEPGEIAEVLRAHPAVTDAVVVPRDGILVGYVAAPADTAVPELREWCARGLPAHMVPAAVVVLPELPLTPSGKVDREALPRHDRASTGLDGERARPATDTERAVVGFMSELLGGAEVGARDDFFRLGGHSLLVGRLAARIRDAFGTDVPLSELYRRTTAEEIGRFLDGGARGGDGAAPAPPALRRADRSRPLPLSYPQERIWYLEQLSPLNPAYRVQAALMLNGPLDLAALRAALTELVRRHEIFRTGFREIDGVPAQCPVDMDGIELEIPLVDLSALPEAEREDAWRELTRREKARPFRLDSPPLVRWVVVRTAPDAHRLLHLEHHLVHDGWSFAVFVDELTRLYTGFAEGTGPGLPEPSFQFADLAAWQREWLDGPVLERYLDHWREVLDGAPVALELPTDRPRPPEFTFRGGMVAFSLAPDEYAVLRERAREHGVTLYSVMLSGFTALLSRYTAQDDLVVGVGVANRRLSEAERLIGMMVNTVPMRVRFDGDPTFRELIARVHATAVEGYAWQDIPLQRLVKALAPVRDLSRNPLFSALFSFHDSAVPDLDFAGLRGEVAVEHNGSAKADLNIVVIPRAEQRVGLGPSDEDESITVLWEYAADLFDDATMRRMAQAYRDLLRTALASPDTPVSRLPLTGAVTPQPAPAAAAGQTVLDLVERHIAGRPDAVALSTPSGPVTYGELDVLARSVRLPAGPREPVTVPPGPGADLVAAMLAAARRGVPCRVGGTAPARQEHSPVPADVLAVTGDGELTYAAVRCALDALDALGLDAGRVLRAAPVSDPLFPVEVWTTLGRGGTLVLADEDTTTAAGVAAVLRAAEEPFSALLLPDTTANSLLAHHGEALAGGCTALLVLGPDIAPAALRPSAGGPRLATGFGTPELPIALCRAPEASGAGEEVLVPVGAPLPGVVAVVLDRNGEPLPPGIPGELHLGLAGAGAPAPTGRRARRDADGGFAVLGPAGDWPTVAGFRVAPHETRARLTAHGRIAEAAVWPVGDQLHAYLVPRAGDEAPGPFELVEFLAERLPDYQIPARFVTLPALPSAPVAP